jgi:hypothetical protein
MMSPLFKWVNFANGGLIGLKTGEDGKIVLVVTVVATAFYGVAFLKQKWLTSVILGVQAWGTITVFWMGALIWRLGSSLDSAGRSENPFVTMLNMQISPGTGLYVGMIGGIGVAGALGFLAACRVLTVGGFKH